MLSKLRPRSVFDVLAMVAFFGVVAGGGAYAANEWNGSNIQDGTLTGADIQDLSLGLADYGANSISTGKLKDQDVRTQDLRDLGVTNSKIAWDSVSSGKVINNNLTNVDIQDGTLGQADLGTDSVAYNELEFGSVSATHLRPDSVSAGHIVDGTVGESDVTSGVLGRAYSGFGNAEVIVNSFGGNPPWVTVQSLTVPAGAYVIFGKAVLRQTSPSTGRPLCQLIAQDDFDQAQTGIGSASPTVGDDMRTITMTVVDRVAAAHTVTMRCVNSPGSEMAVSQRKITAIRVGTLSNVDTG
jgi:hypothetical protein